MWRDEEVAFVLSELGYSGIKMSPGRTVAHCQCAKKDRSFVVMTAGYIPGYFCHRCKVQGDLAGLINTAWANGRDVYNLLRILSARMIDSEVKHQATYTPFRKYAPKAVAADAVEFTEHESHHGVQLDLKGVDVSEAPRPITEEDLSKFTPGPSKYLLNRGFDAEVQTAFQIMGAPHLRRAVFPIRDRDGAIQGFSRRLVWEGTNCFKCGVDATKDGKLRYKCPNCGMPFAKYLHNKGFQRNTMLYGEWLGTGQPVVVEGMTDAMRLWQFGIRPPFAAPRAIMGATIHHDQALLLLANEGPVWIVRDRDDPSKYASLPNGGGLPKGMGPGDVSAKQIRATIEHMEPSRKVIDVIPPRWKDPGDLTAAEVGWLREQMAKSIAEIPEEIEIPELA